MGQMLWACLTVLITHATCHIYTLVPMLVAASPATARPAAALRPAQRSPAAPLRTAPRPATAVYSNCLR